MKRFLTAVAVAAALTAGLPGMAQAQKGDRWKGPCEGWQYGEYVTSPAEFNADVAQHKRQVRRLVVCVFDHFAPGNASHALYIMERESSGYPWADNPSSHCRGLFQHLPDAWAGRAATYLWRGWFRKDPVSWSDPRANAIVAARMVAEHGWGAWGG